MPANSKTLSNKKDMTKSNPIFTPTCLHLLISVSLCLSFTKATNKIQKGQSINVSETIASPSGDFELRFFLPQKNSTKGYAGIWYNKHTPVWVANRDYPVLTSSATLAIDSNGNIVISDGRMFYMVTNITSTTRNDVYAELLDSGNLVLRESGSGNNLWQSFHYPTDTLLSGLNISEGNFSLVSWKSVDDPSPGDFSLELDLAKKQLIIKNKSDTNSLACYGSKNASLLFHFILNRFGRKNMSELYRIVLDESGQLKLQSCSDKNQSWVLLWDSQKDRNPTGGSISEAERGAKKDITKYVLIISLALATLLMMNFAIILYCRRKHVKKEENLLLFDVEMSLEDTPSELPDLTQRHKIGRKRRKPCKLVFFTLSSVTIATENFSDAQKIGEGGFGSVYKGSLKKGHEVAIKRLSEKSGQGNRQFKNEAHLIARLQHKNLVRLLGCCIERNEKILIYEYMTNKSLDFFLYDPIRRKHLTWQIRVKIVEGIAHGLLYLHQFSRIRIIHRDLKPSNILLDNDMNPKISDFGVARIFKMNQLHESTVNPAGTIGYMSPEYAHQGLFSERSDVFSFGVLLLEIVSGRKNTDSHSSETRGLLAYAWELWTSDRGLELIDPIIEDHSAKHMTLRYVHIALLCVQEIATDRPYMSQVVLMLTNSSSSLPYPKPPAFLSSTSTVRQLGPTRRGQENWSANDMTVSDSGPR